MSEIVDDFNGVGSGRSEAQVSNPLKLVPQDIKEEWAAALNSKDCTRLMALLQQHPPLWLKRASKGRTVLHVAVMQGCVELVKLVLRGPLANGTQQEFKKFLDAKDGKCRADAFQLSSIVGNQEVIQALDDARQPEFLKRLSRPTPYDVDSSDASRHIGMNSDSSLKVEIIDLLKELPNSKLRESLQKQMKEDVDYNFEEQREGLIFNFACKRAHSNIDFLKSVSSKAQEKNKILWQKLFTQMDAQGRTPLHVAVEYCQRTVGGLDGIGELLDLMPYEGVNARDGAGRTPLMRATANGMTVEESKVVKVLANDDQTDFNAKWLDPENKSCVPGAASKVTALHLAVLHAHEHAAKYVIEAHREDPEKRAKLEEKTIRRIRLFKRHSYLTWTPLELAAVMGRSSVLVYILKACEKLVPPREAIHDEYCLHLAAAAGDPRSIQELLQNRSNNLQNFQTNRNFGGFSCLHFAVSASLPHQSLDKEGSVEAIDEAFDRFLAFSDFASIYWLEKELTTAEKKGTQKRGMPGPGYGGKKTCTTLLLQAGVEIWPSGNFLAATSGSTGKDISKPKEDSPEDSHDFHDRSALRTLTMPEPGSDATDDARLWWFELVVKETLDAKNNFNAAGNATAVVATLVATASFMGPISPPLGYGSDASSAWTFERVQMASLPVRIFIASNSLSFYLGIASIMLAIMPSLPMPQEGVREELCRSQRVALAISVLLLSILGVLVSFTSALIAVMPQHHYWSYTLYPAVVGGIICIVVILLFFLRVLRLVFNRNAGIKTFYHRFGIL